MTDLGHVLGLSHVGGDGPSVPGAVGALRAGAGGVAVGVVVRVHAVVLVAPPGRLLLRAGGEGRGGGNDTITRYGDTAPNMGLTGGSQQVAAGRTRQRVQSPWSTVCGGGLKHSPCTDAGGCLPPLTCSTGKPLVWAHTNCNRNGFNFFCFINMLVTTYQKS